MFALILLIFFITYIPKPFWSSINKWNVFEWEQIKSISLTYLLYWEIPDGIIRRGLFAIRVTWLTLKDIKEIKRVRVIWIQIIKNKIIAEVWWIMCTSEIIFLIKTFFKRMEKAQFVSFSSKKLGAYELWSYWGDLSMKVNLIVWIWNKFRSMTLCVLERWSLSVGGRTEKCHYYFHCYSIITFL